MDFRELEMDFRELLRTCIKKTFEKAFEKAARLDLTKIKFWAKKTYGTKNF